MIVAITGGTGFIGRALVERHLALGDDVRVLSRRPLTASSKTNPAWFRGDLENADGDLRAFSTNADVLYHCAGEIRSPTKMHAVHVEGTNRLIDAASGVVRRWVQLSSVGAYGPRRDGNVTEETPAAPRGTYETTKTQADESVIAAGGRGAFTAAIVRPANVIGPAMSNRSLFQLIAAIARGRFVFIGAPGARANYVHVDNVVEALVLAGRANTQCAIYNVSDSCSFEQLAKYVCDELRCPAPKFRVPEWAARLAAQTLGNVPGFPLTVSRVDALSTRTTYPTGKIAAELGYRPVISIENAIRQMAAAWRDNVAP